jgi:hypothetical protein
LPLASTFPSAGTIGTLSVYFTSPAREDVAAVGDLMHRVRQTSDCGALRRVAVEEAIDAAAVGLLPLAVPVRVELEKEQALATRPGTAGAPGTRGEVAAVGSLDERVDELARVQGTAAVEAAEAALPAEVPVCIDLDDVLDVDGCGGGGGGFFLAAAGVTSIDPIIANEKTSTVTNEKLRVFIPRSLPDTSALTRATYRADLTLLLRNPYIARQSGYSSFRQVRGSAGWVFGVRSSRKLKYGATNGSGADTV